MDREAQDRLNHFPVAVECARGERLDPLRQRWLVVPSEPVPTEHTESSDNANRTRGMALHDGGAGYLGEHDEVAFGTGGPVEKEPLVVMALGATKEPARQTIDKRSGDTDGLLNHSGTGDFELRPRAPALRSGLRVEQGSAARNTPFVNGRSEGEVDFFQEDGLERLAAMGRQTALLQFLGEASEPVGPRRAHGTRNSIRRSVDIGWAKAVSCCCPERGAGRSGAGSGNGCRPVSIQPVCHRGVDARRSGS